MEKYSEKRCGATRRQRTLDVYSSLDQALRELRPDFDWISLRRAARGYWNHLENHRIFFDHLGAVLGLQNLSQWNEISVEVIKQHGGAPLLSRYANLGDALRAIYPEHAWDYYERASLPQHYWEDFQNVIDFVKRLEKEYRIQNEEDWYRISRQQIIRLHGSRLLQNYAGLYGILKAVYPDHQWDLDRMKRSNKRASQRWLFLQVSQLLGSGVEVLEEYVPSDMKRITGQTIEFDVFVSSLRVAFEYHGEHHYLDSPFFGANEIYQTRDRQKRHQCQEHNIHLVEVPYWWDGTTHQLLSLIRTQTPHVSVHFPHELA